MSIAYCIAAHGYQRETRRLAGRLLDDDPQCAVVLHYDPRHGSLPTDGLDPSRLHLLRQRPVHWGGIELLEVKLEMLRTAFDQGHSYAVLVSGQDYPVRNAGDFEAELGAFDVWSHMTPLLGDDGTCLWSEGRRRYNRQWVRLTRTGVPVWLAKLNRLAVRSRVLPLSSRDWPGQRFCSYYQTDQQLWWGKRSKGPGVPVWGGSNWMDLSRPAMSAILSAPPSLLSYFRRVPMPSEAYFHTVLRNSEGLSFAPDYRRHIRFSGPDSHPAIMTVDDLDEMQASGARFARKFDMAVDAEVYDRLDDLAVRQSA